MSNNDVYAREIQEAIQAGRKVLSCLYGAKDHLSSARNYGIWDMLGGGFLSGMLKHSKIDQAGREIDEAKYNLKLFEKELSDVSMPSDLRVEIGSFVTFADFFFDGILADWYVQSKIKENYEEVVRAIAQIEKIISRLEGMLYTR